MKKIIAMFVIAAIFLLGVIPVFAADSSVEYNNAREFVFNPQDGDLFQDFKGIMPGDEKTQEIVDFTVYYSKTKNGEKTQIQSGLASEEGNLTTDVKLGTYMPNESGYITVSIKAHPEMDNQYKNSIGKIKWIFTVSEGDRITDDGMIPGSRPSPNTGVTFVIGGIAIGVIIVAIIILVALNKKNKNEVSLENSEEKKDNINET